MYKTNEATSTQALYTGVLFMSLT